MDPSKTFQPMIVSPKKDGSKSVLNINCEELAMESCVKFQSSNYNLQTANIYGS